MQDIAGFDQSIHRAVSRPLLSLRTSGTAISANHRNADVSSECVGGHQGACRYEFGDEKGRGRIRNGSPAGA